MKPYAKMTPVERVCVDLLVNRASRGFSECSVTASDFLRKAVAGGFEGSLDAAMGALIVSPAVTCEVTSGNLIRIKNVLYANSVVTMDNLRSVIHTLSKRPWLSANSLASSSGVWLSRVDSCLALLRDLNCLDRRRVTPCGGTLHSLVIGSIAWPK